MTASEFELRMKRQHKKRMLAIGTLGWALVLAMSAIADIHFALFVFAMSIVAAGGFAVLYAVIHWDDK